ncbi:glycosyltransferase [Hassallia byssoidea VB512170]|uniref:Glycosyltransferase n=1 Tax=Hassallia byssoidea VB512170 TaxID=1304833 RepID=A0A846HEQ6_9CYAN|nr:glycosyltransferase [Hassalia byssoidea]NEU75438.1 glycosyltransferase [Hassalia byssoidea VB512170]
MAHIGLICPAMTGHLNTMLPLGRELQIRGHQVTLFGLLDNQRSTLAAGLNFQAIGESEFPAGAMTQLEAEQGKLVGSAALQYCISWLRKLAITFLEETPQALKQAGVDALLVDQVSPEGGTIAEYLNIPFATVCSGLILNRDKSVPPYGTLWSYSPNWWAPMRNRVAHIYYDFLERSIWEAIFKYRRKWNLPFYSSYDDYFSPLVQLSQQPAEFEFPRTTLPKWFHFTGPYHNSSGRKSVSFPYEKLTGQPLIYASLGTVMGHLVEIFKTIAEAVDGLDAQLVISLGGATSSQPLPELSGSPLVVEYAPQLELLQKTALTITHAGMNTTLECLSHGVPMVAIPICNDQPGVATRIAWTGSGEFVPVSQLSVPKLRTAIKRVLTENSYKKNATRLQQAIRQAGGINRAADIIEQMIFTKKPVFA